MLAIVVAGCKKIDVAVAEFDVRMEKMQYRANEPVKFLFEGNPDNISFFSGEAGSRYENRDRIIANGTPELNFTTYRRNENTGTQQNTMFLYASTDFSGKTDAASIAAANWVDLTDRATWSTGVDQTPSGTLDLREFISDKPVYFAFKYMGYAGSVQRVWNIKSFNIVNVLPGEPSSAIVNLDNAGWTKLSLSGAIEWTISTGNVYFFGPSSAATIGVANEDWLVSKPLFLNKVFPDRPKVLKNISSRMSEYQYTFTSPGTYQVTFLASNINTYEENKIVKSMTIEILP